MAKPAPKAPVDEQLYCAFMRMALMLK